MTKPGLIIASFLGLALAVTATILLRTAGLAASNDTTILVLDVIAAGIAGRVILGRRRPFRYLTLGIVVLSAVGAGFFSTAVTTYLITNKVWIGATIASAITGGILYLIAATLYGFAGTKLGVRLMARIGLVLLLLLAMSPGLNVLGLLAFAILAFVRRPWATTSATTPEPAAVSG
jgi:hypothetical protein